MAWFQAAFEEKYGVSELQTLDESDRGIDVEELLVQLKHVLDILQSDEKGGNHYEKDNI